jgi:hypothetical protein
MPIFEIEQYELHVQRYRIEANDEADAIAALFAGEADAVDNSLEYIEVADDCGMLVTLNRALAEKLLARGVICDGDDRIPSVRSIERMN